MPIKPAAKCAVTVRLEVPLRDSGINSSEITNIIAPAEAASAHGRTSALADTANNPNAAPIGSSNPVPKAKAKAVTRLVPIDQRAVATIRPSGTFCIPMDSAVPQLGKLIGLSAKTTNLRLANLGLQVRNERDEWELTEPGEAWAEALPYSRNGHSGYQILWNPSVAQELREVA